MAGENDLIKLYSERILALATQLPPSSRLDNPEASVKKRSPLCGSAVTVDVKTENGRVSEFAQDVKACALGQASASVIAHGVIGRDISEINEARETLKQILKTGEGAPPEFFKDMEVLRPAKDYKNRHASILLSVEATLEALQSIEKPME